MVDKAGILSRISLFENLPDSLIDSIALITTNHMIEKKESLFIHGMPGETVYVLVQGSVQINTITPDGKEVVLKVVKPGEIFGEVILFERDTYPASAVTLKNSQVFSFRKQDFLKLLEEPQFRDAFIRQIMMKLRHLTQQVQQASTLDVVDRLFHFFEDQYGDVKQFTTGISKKDIALAIGTTAETLSRTIRKLHDCGILTWEGKSVTIHDKEHCGKCL